MNKHTTSWARLLTAARQAPADSRHTSAPAGFATRVSALAFACPEPSFATLFARFAPRALGACALVMVLGVTLNIGAVLQAFEPDTTATSITDPVAEWLGDASS